MPTTPDHAHYAIQHPDGRWLYHLPEPDGFRGMTRTSLCADGQPLERLGPFTDARGFAVTSNWYASDRQAERITAVYQPHPKTVRYELRDQAALSVRYPAQLSVEERNEREGDEYYGLYAPVTEDQEPVEYEYEGPFLVLEGDEPPAPDEPQWVTNLAHQVTQRPEYQHMFPGYIPGLRKHLYELIKAMPRVRHCFDGYNGFTGIHVVLSLPFDPPVTRWKPNLGRNLRELKSGRNVTVHVDRSMDLPVPDRVPGANHAEARANWERQVEFWLSVVTDATIAACSACGGTGHVPAGSEKYMTKR